jgi:hypothetical protein
MDPLSAAVVAAVAAGLVQGAGDVAKKVLVDGYDRLRRRCISSSVGVARRSG